MPSKEMASTSEVLPQGRALWRAVLRSEWARLRRLWDLFPVTWLGAGLISGAYAAIAWMAHAQLDLVWLVVGYVGLALSVLCPLLTWISLLWLRWRLPPSADTDTLLLETGTFSDTGFALPQPWYLPLLQLRWEWLEPADAEIVQEREGGRLRERVKLAERGRSERIVRRIVVRDVFGLGRAALYRRQTRAVDVLPRYGGLKYLPALTSLAAGDAAPHPMGLSDGDRLELRRYTTGDPARFIHWKVFSRTRRLMVRTPERALSIARRTAAFLVAGERDDASAAVARLAIEQRLLGSDWVFGTDLDIGGAGTGRQRIGDALDCLMRSGQKKAREQAGLGLAAFVARVEREGPASLLLFAPSRPGAWLERVLAVARRHKLRVVIGIDGVYQRERPPLWERFLTFAPFPEGALAAELDATVYRLAQAGIEVSVFDRFSGMQLGAAHRQAMLSQGAA